VSIKQLKFIVKHSLKRGPVFTWWYWVCESRRIHRWRNPHQARPLESVPIHVLAGAEQFHMALWMLASFTHQTGRNWEIQLHDDGSLPAGAASDAARLGLSVRVITKSDADSKIRATLQPFPACMRHYEAFFMAQKFYGPVAFSSSEKQFVLDTDILYFAPPSELMRWVDSPDGEMWFNRDLSETCQLPARACKDELGFDLWPEVNAGLSCVHNPSVQLKDTERFLELVERQQTADQWMLEQTLYALHASQNNKGGLLPPKYELSVLQSRRDDSVCRHYVGAVRDLFFTEGIREIAKQLGLAA
jgi:hypothetical protein